MATPHDRLASILDARQLLDALGQCEELPEALRSRSRDILCSYPSSDDIRALAAREELLVELRPRMAPGRILAMIEPDEV